MVIVEGRLVVVVDAGVFIAARVFLAVVPVAGRVLIGQVRQSQSSWHGGMTRNRGRLE